MLNIARRWRFYHHLASHATTAVIDAPVFTVVIGHISIYRYRYRYIDIDICQPSVVEIVYEYHVFEAPYICLEPIVIYNRLEVLFLQLFYT